MRKLIATAVAVAAIAPAAPAVAKHAPATHKAKKPNAARTCRAERAADPAAFKLKYGTGKHHANAFGKCVSATVKAQHKAHKS